jgi:hypothetical protein
MCLACEPSAQKMGDMWMVNDMPHEMDESCYTCSCPSDQHRPVDYLVKCELVDHSTTSNPSSLKHLLSTLLSTSAEFSYFLMYVVGSQRGDLFHLGLLRMIDEENHLSLIHQSNHLNQQLANDLRQLKDDHQSRLEQIKVHHRYATLPDIYKLIQTIREYPMIREQLTAAKLSHAIISKQYDLEISCD